MTFASSYPELHYQYRCGRLGWGFLTGRPVHCNLQITWRCNFQCQICDFWKTPHRREDELTPEQIRIVGRKLNQLGSLIISLAGGEPLIREDLAEVVRTLRECNHFPILITNGWFVDEARAQELSDAGLQEISVSVDYADPAKHDAMRGRPGSWDRATKALEMLQKHRRDGRNRVHMISVLMDDNLDEIEPLIKLSRELGVTYMLSLYSGSRGAKPQRLPEQQVTARLLDLKKRYPEFVTLTSYIERLDQAIADGGIGNCQAGKLLFNIDTHGTVSRCIDTLTDPAGNILTDDIRTIQRNLAALQKNNPCSQCWTSCRGFAESMRQPGLRQYREFFHSVKKV